MTPKKEAIEKHVEQIFKSPILCGISNEIFNLGWDAAIDAVIEYISKNKLSLDLESISKLKEY